MLFVNLAPDVLSEILDWIGGGIDLIQLWLTGDRKLHHLLKDRGILRSATFAADVNGRLSICLPRMLNSLSFLRTLKLVAFARIATPSQLWETLSTLRNLQSLYLELPSAEEWLLAPKDEIEAFSSLFASLEETDASTPTLPSPNGHYLRPMADAFPHLEILHLKSSKHFLTLKDIPHFPKSLRALLLPYNVNFDQTTVSHLHHLPNLDTLAITVPEEANFSGLILPARITCLHMNSSASDIPTSFWSLATNLFELNGSFKLSSSHPLPESVLSMTNRHYVSAHSKPSLPSSLTRLAAPSLQQTLSDLSGLPRDLKSLSFTVSSEPDKPVFRSENLVFPALLQQVYVHYVSHSSGVLQVLKNLPLIQQITICSAGEASYNSTSLFGLPKTLTHLQLSYLYYSWTRQDGSNVCHFSDNAIAQLPRGLTYLALPKEIFFITTRSLLDLPRNLKTLDVAVAFDDNDYSIAGQISHLPRSLQTLRLYIPWSVNVFIDEALPNWSVDSAACCVQLSLRTTDRSKWTHDMLAMLPKTCLTNLSLMDAFDTIWTGEALASLSPNLRKISLCKGEMEASALSELPSSLTSLHIDGVTRLSGKCLTFLPPCLETAVLPVLSSITDDDLSRLPPSLWKLHFDYSNCYLTERGIKALVPAISCFRCRNAKFDNAFKSATSRYLTHRWVDLQGESSDVPFSP